MERPPSDASVGTDEWEALIGVSLAEQIGALVFVIGLAFALSYSFEHTNAAGRAAIALSAAWWSRRRSVDRAPPALSGLRARVDRSGLGRPLCHIVAVWAIPEARVIQSPFIGSLVMLAVAAGMIVHSFRYRAQAVTAVAYFAAFAALAATPSSPFAVVSLVPLAASLLYLAARFGWHSMALFGLAATYLTCLSRGDSNAPLATTQALFLTYWLLFEGFDLIRVARRLAGQGLDLLFPLNTAAFLSLSYLTWSHRQPGQLWLASAFAAAIFLGDAVARAFLRPPSTFLPEDDLLSRLRAGSYEGAVVVSAVLSGLAIVGRVPGIWTSIGIALEAEIVYLAGVWLESPFLRRFGGRAFVLSLARLFWLGDPWSRSNLLGHATWNWTPPVLFHASLFYLNRAIRQPNAVFSSAAAGAIALAIAVETPHAFIGAALLIFGALLFEFSHWKSLHEFRMQAYVMLIGGIAITTIFNIGRDGNWRALTIALVIAYSSALRHRMVAAYAAASTALFAMLLLWTVVPAEYLAASWFALGLLLFELGNKRLPAELRHSLGPVIGVAWFALLTTHSEDFTKFPALATRVAWFAACAACWLAAARVPSAGLALRYIMTALGTTAAMAALWLILPNSYVPLAWMLIALAMLGLRVRWISCGIAALAFAAIIFYDIDPPQLLAAVPVVIALYAAQFISKRDRESAPPVLFSLLATLLWSAVLHGKVSGGLLTVAWGLEGLLLLGAGFVLRERVLRLQGLVLLLVCILKLFLYDMRNLETLYRILSFIALGLILLCVSWIYSRFREHVKNLL